MIKNSSYMHHQNHNPPQKKKPFQKPQCIAKVDPTVHIHELTQKWWRLDWEMLIIGMALASKK